MQRKQGGRNGKITVMHQRKHWTQYLEGILEVNNQFVLRRSWDAEAGYQEAPSFDANDPETMDVVITGRGRFLTTFVTRWHRVLMRMQHSPGWGLEVFLEHFLWAERRGIKVMIPEYVWTVITKSDFLKKNILRIREQIIKKEKTLLFTHFDPKLNRIFNAAQKKERKLGTALVSCNWRIAATQKDTECLTKAIKYLAKDLKVSVLVHPNTMEPPIKTERRPILFLKALRSAGISDVFTQDNLAELTNLYDEYEFIITDGSGTAYEAIARGCKGLTLDGLSYQANVGIYRSALELGLLPKTLVWDYKNHSGSQVEMKWLKRLYPTSLVKEDVTPLVAQEIIDIFNHWN